MVLLQYGERYDVPLIAHGAVCWADERMPDRYHKEIGWISEICNEEDMRKIFLLMDLIMFIDNLLAIESSVGGFIYRKDGRFNSVVRYDVVDDSYVIYVGRVNDLTEWEVMLPEDERIRRVWASSELVLLSIAIREVRRRIQSKKMVNIFDGKHLSSNNSLNNQIHCERMLLSVDEPFSQGEGDFQESVSDKDIGFDVSLIQDYFIASVLRRKGTLGLDTIRDCLLLSQ